MFASNRDVQVIESNYKEYVLFHDLWRKVALELRNLENVSMDNIERAADLLKNPFRNGQKTSDFANIDFDDVPNCCAYLMKFATCHTSLTKFATEQFADRIRVLDDVMSRGALSVVSLGGGPGCDVMGFCNALAQRWCTGPRINVCVLDLWTQWKFVQREVIEAIATRTVGTHGDFFRDMQVYFEFQQVDLVAAASGGRIAPVERINTADIILCVKFLSILKDEDKQKTMKMVFSRMKHGSLFLFVDTQAHLISNWARRERNLQILVEPEPKRFYKLNCCCGDCIEKSSFQLCAIYRPMPPVINIED